jgi:GDP-mannose 6-dehydrogenase
VGVEPNEAKLRALNSGHSAIKEPGLDALVCRMVTAGRLSATSDGLSLVPWADASLICVGTPSASDGAPGLDCVRNVVVDIGRGLRAASNYHVVALRSTVFPGTARTLVAPLLEAHAGRCTGDGYGLVMSPEFLRETTAIADFLAPPYTIIGEYDRRSGDTMEALYCGVGAPIYRTALEEAEMLKLVNNAFHALKIGFANEVGRLCDPLGIDSHAVMSLVCADTKLNISSAYLRPGFAFGGSCLPKDLRSLTCHARRLAAQLPILEAILPSNRIQVELVRRKVHELGARRVAVLGLSFKPYTDDLRESPIIELLRDLWEDGIDVLVHDPDVCLEETLGSNREYLERQLPQVRQILRADVAEVLREVEVVIVSHRRPEFQAALETLNGHATVLDLVRLEEQNCSKASAKYRGLSW